MAGGEGEANFAGILKDGAGRRPSHCPHKVSREGKRQES